MTIRITLHKDAFVGWNGRETPAREQVREFADHMEAADWLVHDSYFAEGYTRRLLWEVVDDVPAIAPPPSVAAEAPTLSVADVVRTSGPLDPEVHAALVRVVERAREDQEAAAAGVYVRQEVQLHLDARARRAELAATDPKGWAP